MARGQDLVGPLGRLLGRGMRLLLGGGRTDTLGRPTGTVAWPGESRGRPRGGPGGGPVPYPGDFTGDVDALDLRYAPDPDGDPDPGEVVWAWVPFEDDPARGKDRPALVIGRAAGLLLALQMTSKDHDRDAAQERGSGRVWVDVGAGPWDRRGRPSEVRVNRVLRLDPRAVRREGGRLDREVFDRVVGAVRGNW